MTAHGPSGETSSVHLCRRELDEVKAEEHKTQALEMNGVRLEVRSYKIGNTYHCHVANVDPGATIARASAPTEEEAVRVATEKARERVR